MLNTEKSFWSKRNPDKQKKTSLHDYLGNLLWKKKNKKHKTLEKPRAHISKKNNILNYYEILGWTPFIPKSIMFYLVVLFGNLAFLFFVFRARRRPLDFFFVDVRSCVLSFFQIRGPPIPLFLWGGWCPLSSIEVVQGFFKKQERSKQHRQRMKHRCMFLDYQIFVRNCKYW